MKKLNTTIIYVLSSISLVCCIFLGLGGTCSTTFIFNC